MLIQSYSVAVAISFACMGSPAPQLEKQLKCSFLIPGNSIWIATIGAVAPMEAVEHLVLSFQGKVKVLAKLDDLKGAVAIDTPEKALSFVRLRTSRKTWYMWRDAYIIEIANPRLMKQFPNYGIKPRSEHFVSSGYDGILSDKAFVQGHFSPPLVLKTITGFTIKRCLFDDEREFQQVLFVEEKIETNGSYHRNTLKSYKPPRIPGTSWYITRFQ